MVNTTEYKTFKLNAVPDEWEPDSVYYILSGGFIVAYVTDSNGDPKTMHSADIEIQNSVEEVADVLTTEISERQAADASLQNQIDNLPAPGGGTSIQIAANYAAIGSSTTARLIYVNVDETNNNDSSVYIHNGTILKFSHTLP